MLPSYFRTKINAQNFLNPNWTIPKFDKYAMFLSKIKDVVSQEWLDYAFQLGLEFNDPLVFFKIPNITPKRGHVDVFSDGKTIISGGLNFIIGGKDSEMLWYDSPSQGLDLHYTSASLPYSDVDVSILNEVDRFHLPENTLTLVRTDIPHTIKTGNQVRVCVSLRLLKNESTWESLIEFYKEKDLLIDHV